MTRDAIDQFVMDLNELCEQYNVTLSEDCGSLMIEPGRYIPFSVGTIYSTHIFLDT